MIQIWCKLCGGVEGVRQKWYVIRCRGKGVASVLDVQSLFFYWICAMIKHHVELNVNNFLTRNLPFDSDIRKWNYPLMIPLHCLWATSNNRTRGQLECYVTCFFLFWFRLLTSTVSFGDWVSFEIGRPRSKGWKDFGSRWAERVEGLKNWTVFMDIIRRFFLSH